MRSTGLAVAVGRHAGLYDALRALHPAGLPGHTGSARLRDRVCLTPESASPEPLSPPRCLAPARLIALEGWQSGRMQRSRKQWAATIRKGRLSLVCAAR